MSRSQTRGSIPDALPLASSRSMHDEFQVLELEIPQELGGIAAGQRARTTASGAFSHPHQGLDRSRRGAARRTSGEAPRQGCARRSHPFDHPCADPCARSAAGGDPARGGLRRRRDPRDRQARRPRGTPGRRQYAPHSAKCICSARTRPSLRCPVPASSTGSTRTPAVFWSSRARRVPIPRSRRQLLARSVAREYLAICVG